MRGLNALGIDGAVSFAFLARVINIVGSTGTVLLIVRVLSPVEQGYYYTLLSLVSLQLVFELGFSFVVQQLAAHECVHLRIAADGKIAGDAAAHGRLASALQFSLRWYTVAAAAMGLTVAPLGMMFFSSHAAPEAANVHWQAPWLFAIAASMAGLWCLPFYSFLEGCGEVRAVAAMRLRQALAALLLAWAAMLSHHGLYAPGLVIAGQVGAGSHFLMGRRRLLAGLLRHPARDAVIRWSSEVWPFQWRIAVSWMCSYFTVQAFIPIVFALRGAVEAGQLGMSLSIAGYMTVLALVWTSTKATAFAQMIARGEFESLDRLFFHALRQSMVVFAALALAAIAVAALLPQAAPRLAARMVPAWIFAVLVLGAGASHIVQSLAIVLRCFKREPFLGQSLLVAALTVLAASAAVPTMGDAGAAIGYLFANGCVGLPVACLIFARRRNEYRDDSGLPRRRHLGSSPLALQSEARRLPL